MAGSVKVCVSGPLFSALFYEHAIAISDQEGFFLGEVSNRITDVISDSQMQGEKQETYLNIYGFIPCHGLFSFYDSSGDIKEEALECVLNGKHKDVIGWYKCRRNSSLQVSLREKTLHTNLAEKFISIYDRHFIFGIFTSTSTTNHGTHSFDQTFLHYNGWSFQPLPVRIGNLRDMDHSEYHTFPVSALNIHSGQYSEVLTSKQFSKNYNEGAVNQAKDVLLVLQEKLEGLEEKLEISEAILTSKNMEVDELRKTLAEKLKVQNAKPQFSDENAEMEGVVSEDDDYDEDNLRT